MSHKFEVLLGLVATQIIVIALALYMATEPQRLDSHQNEILAAQLDEAMTLYAENCAVCHGLNGEGIGANPPLDNAGLAEMAYEDLAKTIARGRYGTAMPAWSKEDGGPLSDYQISEMVALIQYGDWQATGERVVNLGLAPLVPFQTEADSAILEQVATLTDGETLVTGLNLYAQYCVACHGADGYGSAIAPAINDPAVRDKPAEELQRTLNYGIAGTLMASWTNQLNPDEIGALITLIQRWDEVPDGAIPQPDTPLPTTTESLARGEELFAANCARCHGPEGQGTPRAPALNVKSFLTDTSDLAMQTIITNGVPGTAMPAWGDRMTEADIQAIVGFIRQWEPTAPEVATPVRFGGGGPPWMRNTNTSPSPMSTDNGMAGGMSAGNAPAASGQGHGAAANHGAPANEATNPAFWANLNWPIILAAIALLSLIFTLIISGYSLLKKET